MPKVGFKASDLLRDKIVTPAWYRVMIDSVGDWTPAKDQSKGPSNNMVLEGTILFNAENGSEEFQGVPIGGMGVWNFNSKATGFALGLAKSMAEQCGYKVEDITPETEIEFKTFEGKVVDVFIINDTYQGRLKNKVDHRYRAPKLN